MTRRSGVDEALSRLWTERCSQVAEACVDEQISQDEALENGGVSPWMRRAVMAVGLAVAVMALLRRFLERSEALHPWAGW